jgi:hypothetical protein
MRTLTLVVAASLAAGVPVTVASSPVHAAAAKPRPELVAKNTAGAVSTTRISVGTVVKNKGNKKARASAVTFYLSRDRQQSSDDKTVGSTTVGKIKPKRFKTATGVFNLPAGLAAGSYYVVACADSGHVVRERKENNNCKGAEKAVQIAATTNKQVTVTYSSSFPIGLVGSVTGMATGGTCTDDPVTGGGSCVVAATTGVVKLTASTPLPPLVLHFAGWSGSCTGTTNPYTLSNLSADAACTATFTP